jgi:hypothetical protein
MASQEAPLVPQSTPAAESFEEISAPTVAVAAPEYTADPDAPVGDDEAESGSVAMRAQPRTVASSARVGTTAQLQATAVAEMTLSDKLDSVLDTLPSEMVRFIEDEMRGRFVGVRAC